MSLLRRPPALILVGTAISVAALYLGAWWVPFPVGLLLGLLVPRARFSIPAGAAVGFVAWTVPLVGEQVQYGLRPAASSIAAIMGLTGAADLPVALTILVGTLLGASGGWLGSAARTVVPARRDSARLVPNRPLPVEDSNRLAPTGHDVPAGR